MIDYAIIILQICCILGIFLIPATFLARILVALFSQKMREEIRKRKLFHALWFVASLAVFSSLFLFVSDTPNLHVARRAKTEAMMAQIYTAILNYQIEYSAPPPGNDNASLIKTLEGDNPRKIQYLTLNSRDTDAKGEALDAWGTPLRISIADPQHPVIQSAGPNKTWNSSDKINGMQTYP